MPKFKVVRHFLLTGSERTIKRNLTMDEALAHVKDPETASTTATSPQAQLYTRKFGPWYDKWMTDSRGRRRRSS